MMIKAESYKIFSEIYCPILPAPLELFFGDGYRSVYSSSYLFDIYKIGLKTCKLVVHNKFQEYTDTCKSLKYLKNFVRIPDSEHNQLYKVDLKQYNVVVLCYDSPCIVIITENGVSILWDAYQANNICQFCIECPLFV